jgi:hypothetical protein
MDLRDSASWFEDTEVQTDPRSLRWTPAMPRLRRRICLRSALHDRRCHVLERRLCSRRGARLCYLRHAWIAPLKILDRWPVFEVSHALCRCQYHLLIVAPCQTSRWRKRRVFGPVGQSQHGFTRMMNRKPQKRIWMSRLSIVVHLARRIITGVRQSGRLPYTPKKSTVSPDIRI